MKNTIQQNIVNFQYKINKLIFKVNRSMLLNKIRYSISLASIKHNYNLKRNIIIHHGLMGSSKNFRSVSKNTAFSKHSNIHLIDARNHGDSPHTQTHTVQDLADDLYQYIKQQKLDNPETPLTLMGHSMGGIALMQFTKKYSSLQIQKYIERVIVIDISSRPINKKASFQQTGQMLKDMLSINLDQPLPGIYSQIQKFALTPQIGSLIKSSISPQRKWKVNLPILVKYYPQIGSFSLCDNTGRSKLWRRPVDVIYGAKSNYVDEDQIRDFKQGYQQMTNDNFYRVQNAGHWVHFDNTKEFLRIVDFLLSKDNTN